MLQPDNELTGKWMVLLKQLEQKIITLISTYLHLNDYLIIKYVHLIMMKG